MIVHTLLRAVEAGADRPAVADPSESLTYSQLAGRAAAIREIVEQSSSAPHVGLMMPSGVAFAASLYGILWARRCAVPLNLLLQPAELVGVARDAGLDLVLTVRPLADAVEKLGLQAICIEQSGSDQTLRLASAPAFSADETAILLYTSGTSGLPKGVCQTYGSLTSDIDGCIRRAELRSEHRFMGVLPLSHSFGLTAMLLVPVALGAQAYYLPRFSPGPFFEAVRRQRSSVTMMVASMYVALLKAKRGGPDDLASIEYAISGGEALPMKVYEQVRERFGVTILQGYGMTECSPVVSLNIPRTNRPGTVGLPLPNIEARCFDDAGRPLPARAIGELWVRGPIVMKGYYNKPVETAEVLTPEGWYKTGDMASIDIDSYIAITGRKKEMIIVGGDNVYPREVEAVLDELDGVAESAVIGQSDPSRGEVVVAFVIPKEGASLSEVQLREKCRERLAGFKVPRRVVILPDLPRGPTGKIAKRRLVELLPSDSD